MKIYQHYKGGLYQFITSAQEESTGAMNAVYRCLSSGKVFVRPHNEFHGTIEVDDQTLVRFQELWSD